MQFGIVGIVLFFYFWVWVYKKIKPTEATVESIHLYKMGVLILAFVFIESVAGSAFLQGGGIVAMILLGLVVRDISRIKEKQQFRLSNE